jgi:hypothetical protein
MPDVLSGTGYSLDIYHITQGANVEPYYCNLEVCAITSVFVSFNLVSWLQKCNALEF